jgi:type I restriction enzyme, S subunit
MNPLPQGWRYAPLMELVELHDNRRIPLNAKQRAVRRGSYPYYGANGQVDTIDEYIFDGDYILLAEDGGYFDTPSRGVAYEVSGKFWVNNHAHILSTKSGISRRYLTYALNNIEWIPFVGGSTRLKLTQEGMRKVHIPLAPRQEQLRIATSLDSLLAHSKGAGGHLGVIPNLIERYKKAVLDKAFAGALSKSGRFRSMPFGEIIASTFYGPRFASNAYVEQGIPTLRTTDIGEWGDLIAQSPPQVSVSPEEF